MEHNTSSVAGTPMSGHQPFRANLRSALAAVMAEALTRQELSQVSAARICETDQPSISKIVAGRWQTASAEKLFTWLSALGWDVEITLKRSLNNSPGSLSVKLDD